MLSNWQWRELIRMNSSTDGLISACSSWLCPSHKQLSDILTTTQEITNSDHCRLDDAFYRSVVKGKSYCKDVKIGLSSNTYVRCCHWNTSDVKYCAHVTSQVWTRLSGESWSGLALCHYTIVSTQLCIFDQQHSCCQWRPHHWSVLRVRRILWHLSWRGGSKIRQ